MFFVAIIYFMIALSYLLQRQFAWSIVWGSYGLANIGLMLASPSHD